MLLHELLFRSSIAFLYVILALCGSTYSFFFFFFSALDIQTWYKTQRTALTRLKNSKNGQGNKSLTSQSKWVATKLWWHSYTTQLHNNEVSQGQESVLTREECHRWIHAVAHPPSPGSHPQKVTAPKDELERR